MPTSNFIKFLQKGEKHSQSPHKHPLYQKSFHEFSTYTNSQGNWKWRQFKLKVIPHHGKAFLMPALHLGCCALLEKPFFINSRTCLLKTAHYRHPIHSRKNSLNPNLQQTSLSTHFCKQINFQTHHEETRLGFIIPLDEEESLSELLELLELLLLP